MKPRTRASPSAASTRITDIYATSIDYDKNAELTQTFYATVQNKLHWAITGQTAAEIVKARADASKPNMGLTTWKNAPTGPIRKHDVAVAKNCRRDRRPQPRRHHVPRLCRRPGPPQEPYAHGRLDQEARRLSPIQRAEHPHPCRQGFQGHRRGAPHREYARHEEDRRLREATEPVSDFDRVVEDVTRLEASSTPKNPAAREAGKNARYEEEGATRALTEWRDRLLDASRNSGPLELACS
ncbi:MAG: virulence RhuM family protein [Phycisphaerales bacterium]|nr:virulence RhuM family protein [Phycisphaerales bacterium]